LKLSKKRLDSLQLIRTFVDSKKALFFGVEMIVYSICVVSVTISVESIIESFVSVYENRINTKRLITEERVHHEMLVAINGTKLAHCDSLVKASMENYWRNFKH